jgi:hypothetical protein
MMMERLDFMVPVTPLWGGHVEWAEREGEREEICHMLSVQKEGGEGRTLG